MITIHWQSWMTILAVGLVFCSLPLSIFHCQAHRSQNHVEREMNADFQDDMRASARINSDGKLEVHPLAASLFNFFGIESIDSPGDSPGETSDAGGGESDAEIGWHLDFGEVTAQGIDDVSESDVVDRKSKNIIDRHLHKKVATYAFAYPQPPHNKHGAFVYYDEAGKVVLIRYVKGPGFDVKLNLYIYEATQKPWRTHRPVQCRMRPIPSSFLAPKDAQMFCWKPKCTEIETDVQHSSRAHKSITGGTSSTGVRFRNLVESGCMLYQMPDGSYRAYVSNRRVYRFGMIADIGHVKVKSKAGHMSWSPWSLLSVLVSIAFPVMGLQS